MSHPNAVLPPRHRLKVARLVVDDGWPISEVAARFQVSWPTVKRWVDRYLAGESMQDRTSRPQRSPNRTPKAVTKRCVSLRQRLLLSVARHVRRPLDHAEVHPPLPSADQREGRTLPPHHGRRLGLRPLLRLRGRTPN